MKVIRELDKPVSEIEDCFCNKCGLSIKSPMGSYYGLVEATVTGGYESTELEDGDVHKFSLCENCLKQLFSEFKYGTLQGNFLFDEVPQVIGFDPEVYWNNDKPAPPPPEDESLIQNMDRTAYEPFDEMLDDNDEMVELLNPLPARKKEDLN